jgi:hypothetical protein
MPLIYFNFKNQLIKTVNKEQLSLRAFLRKENEIFTINFHKIDSIFA